MDGQALAHPPPGLIGVQASVAKWSVWLWRDLDNWVRVHGSLEGRTPAMVNDLSVAVWSVLDDIRYPVHVDDLSRAFWAEKREKVLTSALESQEPRKTVPISCGTTDLSFSSRIISV
jgi:hypothetical protein